ncbi:MAG: GyrI-like domain-containing protein [Anaerolineales bacterium]|jgi:effector-binding domain-containing protein|nr:GyrI-like domain-containing protein [Anaerolineales bacterium]
MKAETIIGPGSIVEKPERSYLGIRLSTPFGGMFAVVTKALKELRKWSKENSLSEEGPYFVRYYHCDMKDIMEVEVGLMTNSGLVGEGRIKPGSLPKGKYATLVYRGNGLRGNQALMKWAKDNGITFEPLVADAVESYTCRYEAYLTDYRTEPRKLLWDVELSIKLAD